MQNFLYHWLCLAIGLFLLAHIPFLGIHAEYTSDFFWAALVLLVANTFIRPFLIIISLPLVLVSLGLFLLIINGIIFYCLQDFVPGFHVSSFLGALAGSILLSFITWIFGLWGRKERQEKVRTTQPDRDRGEIIDI